MRLGRYRATLAPADIKWTGYVSPAQLLSRGDLVYVKVLEFETLSRVRISLEQESGVQGALVAQVEPGSPADNAGVARGAVILQVNRNDVRSAGDVQKALSAVPNGEDAMLLIWQNGGSNYVVMHAPSS